MPRGEAKKHVSQVFEGAVSGDRIAPVQGRAAISGTYAKTDAADTTTRAANAGAEVEALRLIDIEKLSFEEAGKRMNISRNTVWRLVETAREKIARAIVQGQEIIVQKEN